MVWITGNVGVKAAREDSGGALNSLERGRGVQTEHSEIISSVWRQDYVHRVPSVRESCAVRTPGNDTTAGCDITSGEAARSPSPVRRRTSAKRAARDRPLRQRTRFQWQAAEPESVNV